MTANAAPVTVISQPVRSSWPRFEADECDAVANVLASGKVNALVHGDECDGFASEFAGFIGARQAICMANGTVTLVGATTENPSFELNAALLSRAQVLILRRLDAAALEQLLDRAEGLMERPLPLDSAAREALLASADGDGRFLLNQVETLYAIDIPEPLDPAGLSALLLVHRRTSAAGVDLRLDHRPPQLDRVLDVTGVLDHLTTPSRSDDAQDETVG